MRLFSEQHLQERTIIIVVVVLICTYTILQSPLKCLEQQGQLICFCSCLRSKNLYEMIDQYFGFSFLVFTSRSVKKLRTWHHLFAPTHYWNM